MRGIILKASYEVLGGKSGSGVLRAPGLAGASGQLEHRMAPSGRCHQPDGVSPCSIWHWVSPCSVWQVPPARWGQPLQRSLFGDGPWQESGGCGRLAEQGAQGQPRLCRGAVR